MYEKLAANKDLAKYDFGFALVTGVGSVVRVPKSNPPKYKPNVGTGTAKDLHTILCGLEQLTARLELIVPRCVFMIVNSQHKIIYLTSDGSQDSTQLCIWCYW